MNQVFINNKSLEFISDINKVDLDKNIHIISYESKKTLEKLINYMLSLADSDESKFYLLNKKKRKHFESELLKLCKYMEAAGGVVRNTKNEILFIYRLNKWDLPKGKIEKDESPKEAAIREVHEETGVENIFITRELISTYHIYCTTNNNKRILKKTFWFELVCKSTKRKLKPQIEEKITKVKWMNKKKAQKALANSYSSIKEVLKSV